MTKAAKLMINLHHLHTNVEHFTKSGLKLHRLPLIGPLEVNALLLPVSIMKKEQLLLLLHKQFLDEDDEGTTSQTKSPISEDLKARLQGIIDRLNSSLDTFVTDCGSIRTRFQEIQDQLTHELNDIISPAVFLEQHQLKLQRAKQRLSDRLERKNL